MQITDINKHIKIFRKQKKLSQKEFAETCGFHFNMVGRYERGEDTPKIAILNKIKKAFPDFEAFTQETDPEEMPEEEQNGIRIGTDHKHYPYVCATIDGWARIISYARKQQTLTLDLKTIRQAMRWEKESELRKFIGQKINFQNYGRNDHRYEFHLEGTPPKGYLIVGHSDGLDKQEKLLSGSRTFQPAAIMTGGWSNYEMDQELIYFVEISETELRQLDEGKKDISEQAVPLAGEDTIKSTYFEDVMASAGNGLINYEEDTKKSLEVSAWVFNTLGVGLPKNELHTIRVFGDSMAPLLNKGDIVFVEPHRNGDILEGEIYVVRFESEIFIKKLQHFPQEERIRLLSINPDYEPMEFKGAELENFSVIGRVIMRLGGV